MLKRIQKLPVFSHFRKSQQVKFATKYLKSMTRQNLIRFSCYFHFHSIFLYIPKSKIPLSAVRLSRSLPFLFLLTQSSVPRPDHPGRPSPTCGHRSRYFPPPEKFLPGGAKTVDGRTVRSRPARRFRRSGGELRRSVIPLLSWSPLLCRHEDPPTASR